MKLTKGNKHLYYKEYRVTDIKFVEYDAEELSVIYRIWYNGGMQLEVCDHELEYR